MAMESMAELLTGAIGRFPCACAEDCQFGACMQAMGLHGSMQEVQLSLNLYLLPVPPSVTQIVLDLL